MSQQASKPSSLYTSKPTVKPPAIKPANKQANTYDGNCKICLPDLSGRQGEGTKKRKQALLNLFPRPHILSTCLMFGKMLTASIQSAIPADGPNPSVRIGKSCYQEMKNYILTYILLCPTPGIRGRHMVNIRGSLQKCERTLHIWIAFVVDNIFPIKISAVSVQWKPSGLHFLQIFTDVHAFAPPRLGSKNPRIPKHITQKTNM